MEMSTLVDSNSTEDVDTLQTLTTIYGTLSDIAGRAYRYDSKLYFVEMFSSHLATVEAYLGAAINNLRESIERDISSEQ